MLALKLLLLLVLAVVPVLSLVFAVPMIRGIAIAGLVGFWMLVPSWGPWVYGGFCANLLQWRAWLRHVARVRMAVWVASPSLERQNSSALWLAIGAAVGCLRSLASKDLAGAVLGGLVAGLLFGLRGMLFSSSGKAPQISGYPVVSEKELVGQAEKTDDATLIQLKSEVRWAGLFGRALGLTLVQMKEKEEGMPDPNQR